MPKLVKPSLTVDDEKENVKLAIQTLNEVSNYIIKKYALCFFNGALWSKLDDVYRPTDFNRLKQVIKRDFTLLTPYQVNTVIDNCQMLLDAEINIFEKDKYKVYFTNGYFDIKTKEFHYQENKDIPFTPNTIPYEWKEWTPAEQQSSKEFDKAMDIFKRIMRIISQDDESLMKLELEIFGSAFAKFVPFSSVFIKYGDGGNGKSTEYKFMMSVIGKDNVTKFSLASLQNQMHYQGTIMNFYGKTFAFDPDSARLTISDMNILKELSGEDVVEGKRLYKDPVQFINYATIAIYTNHPPKITEHNKAIDRRFFYIPKTREISSFKDIVLNKEEYDFLMNNVTVKQIAAKMALNHFADAIANNGFSIPQIVKDETKKFKLESNNVYRWFEETGQANIIEANGEYHPESIYLQFIEWTRANNIENNFKQNGFTQQINKILKNDYKIEVKATTVRQTGKHTPISIYKVISEEKLADV